MKKIKSTNMKINPRAVEALGSDLVTNDNVAVVELIKNSYDAFSKKVIFEIGEDNKYLKISDDGKGMTLDIIENSWATIATSFKLENPMVKRGQETRIVSGNKGLGRLSAARLGNVLEIYTKSKEGNIIYLKIDWSKLYCSSDLATCCFDIYELDRCDDIIDSGTIIKISDLKSTWNDAKITELKDDLSRILNPFKKGTNDFNIFIKNKNIEINLFNYNIDVDEEQVELNEFINNPPYKFTGTVDEIGNIAYEFSYLGNYFEESSNASRKKLSGKVLVEDIKDLSNKTDGFIFNESVSCGKFNFEIRVWELSSDFLDEISSKYQIKGKEIRKTIQQYKGISVYRDGVLVLPKSENAKDWLGLDKRRISQIGRRLSTSQIVGVIDISSSENPNLSDTSDRETFKNNPEYENFYAICNLGIINELQKLRLIYKPIESERPSRFEDIFNSISTKALVDSYEAAIKANATPIALKKVVDDYSKNMEKNIKGLKNRIEYYAQLASAGTFSKLLIHELKTSVNPMQRFLRYAKEDYTPFSERNNITYNQAVDSCARLIKLSDVFLPMSRREFKKEKYDCKLDSEIEYALFLYNDLLNDNKIIVNRIIPEGIMLPLHSGEMQTILINLLDNAVYWVSKKNKKNGGVIEINAKIIDGKVLLNFSDNGEGVDPDLGEKIFEPGITTKLYGFGMGLVVVSELVNSYNGSLKNIQPGDIGGATFEIILPLLRR